MRTRTGTGMLPRSLLAAALVVVGMLVLGAVARAQTPASFFEVTGSPFGVPNTDLGRLEFVTFSPNGELLAAVSRGAGLGGIGYVTMFNVAPDGTLTPAGQPFQGPIPLEVGGSAAFSPTSGLIAVANPGRAMLGPAPATPASMKVFSIEPDGTLSGPIEQFAPCPPPTSTCPGAGPQSVAWSPDGRLLVTANGNDTLAMFRVRTDGTLLGSDPVDSESVPVSGREGAVAFSPDGDLLAVTTNSDQVRVFRTTPWGGPGNPGAGPTLREVASIRNPGDPQSIRWSPNGQLLATAATTSGRVNVFSVEERQQGNAHLPRIVLHRVGSPPLVSSSQGLASVAFNRDGTLLAAQDENTDRVFVFRVADDGTLSALPDSPYTLRPPPGASTRSDVLRPYWVAFNPTRDLIAASELEPNLVAMLAAGGFVIEKRADRAEVAPGGKVTYTITLRPVQPTGASGTVIDDLSAVLDKATYLHDAHLTGPGAVSFDDHSHQLMWTGKLLAGEMAQITYSVQVHGAAGGLLANKVEAPPDSSCGPPPPSAPPCVTNTPIREPSGPAGADLELQKTASLSSAHPGGQVLFTLVVRNHGPDNATGVTVQDPVPPGLAFGLAVPDQGTCTIGADQLVCHLGSIRNGGQALILVTATVAADATGAAKNEASVYGDQHDPNPANNAASAKVAVTPLPPLPDRDPSPQPVSDLAIAKHVSRSRVSAGGRLTYTITVTNRGVALEAARDVRVTDASRLPSRVVSVRPSLGSCRTGPPIRCTLGTLAPGAHATIRIEAVAAVAGAQVNTATVTSGNWDPTTINNIALARTLITPVVKRPPPPFTG